MTNPTKRGAIGVKLHKIRAILTIFFQIVDAICKILQNLMTLPENFDQESKNRQSLGVKL